MNRAERRRQQKLAEKAAKNQKQEKSVSPSLGQQALTIQQAIDLAVEHHNAGRLPEAEGAYQQILQSDPNQPIALHLLGVIAHHVGKYDIAVDLIRKALAIRPDYAEAHYNLGNTLKELNKPDGAVESYHKAISIMPDFAEAHCNLGYMFHARNILDEAAASFHKALAIKPDYAEAHYNLGNTLKDLNKLDEAVESYQRALTIIPEYAEAHSNLGNALRGLNKLDEAVESYKKAVAIRAEYAEAYSNLGVTFQEQNKLNEAVESFQCAILINPDYAEAHYNLGNTLKDLSKLDEAVESYKKAVAIKPDYVEALCNIWFALRPMCLENTDTFRDALSIEKIIDTLPFPPEPDILRFQLQSLLGETTEEAWQRITDNLPDIQRESILNPRRTSTLSDFNSKKSPETKVVALINFGRSGSGYLHSRLDNHPRISDLPGVYMSGFFGRGVWNRIVSDGYQGIPEQFSRLYEVLFDARRPDKIPPGFIGDTYNEISVGVAEGFVQMGPKRDTPLTLDRDQFLENLGGFINNLEDINHGQLFEAIHNAYEKTLGNNFSAKKLILHHSHKNEPYSMANLLKYFPKAQLLMIVRNPVQSCESWALKRANSQQDNSYTTYRKVVDRIIPMLMDLSNPLYPTQDAVAVRLEDIKTKPEETMRRLCSYLGIEEAASLYDSTMQGLQWWGDPSSSLYGRTQTEVSEDDPIWAKVGTFFNAKDQLILGTIFYPLSARLGYLDHNNKQFRKNLDTIRPLLDEPLDFERTLAKTFPQGYPNIENTASFKSLHAVMIRLWHTLEEYGTYPYMIKLLPEN